MSSIVILPYSSLGLTNFSSKQREFARIGVEQRPRTLLRRMSLLLKGRTCLFWLYTCARHTCKRLPLRSLPFNYLFYLANVIKMARMIIKVTSYIYYTRLTFFLVHLNALSQPQNSFRITIGFIIGFR